MNTLEYHFRTSGVYKITVMDEFRTGIDAIVQTIEYKQPIPVGTLAGVEDKGYTNKNVTFTWKDEAVINLTKDGVAVEKMLPVCFFTVCSVTHISDAISLRRLS